MTSLMQLLMDFTHNERIPRCLDHKSYDRSKDAMCSPERPSFKAARCFASRDFERS